VTQLFFGLGRYNTMRVIIRILTLAGCLALGFVFFQNFEPVTASDMTMRSPLEQDNADQVSSEKVYVKIDGKLYEKKSRDIYYVDGVPTFVKNGKPATKPAASAATPKNPNLGPPIDPKIMKDAMGLDENDEFFNHSGSEQ